MPASMNINMEEKPTARGGHNHIELAAMQPTATIAST
jgi:hypothetical protein